MPAASASACGSRRGAGSASGRVSARSAGSVSSTATGRNGSSSTNTQRQVELVGDEARERRPDERRQHPRRRQQREHAAVHLARVDAARRRVRDDAERARAEPLERAPDQQQRPRPGDRGEHAAGGERGDRADVRARRPGAVGVLAGGDRADQAREHERAERPAVALEPVEVARDRRHHGADAERLERDDGHAHQRADADAAVARREDRRPRRVAATRPPRAQAAGLAEPHEVRAPGGLGVAHGAAAERALERAARPVAVRAAGERHARAVALLAREQVEHRAAEQRRVAAAGRERRRAALVQVPRDRRPHVPDLAGEVLRRALEQPRPAQPAREAARPERRRHAGVVRGDVAAREQRRRREHQQLERALDVRRALREQPRGEHVQLALGDPADEVAPPGGRGQPPLERQPRLGGVELRRASRARRPPAPRAAAGSARPAASARARAGRARARRRARRARHGARRTCRMRSRARPR